MIKDNTISFIEVKYLKNTNFMYPREAVNYKKQEKIRKTALKYISDNNIDDKNFSFDILEIIGNPFSVNHIINGF